MTTVNSAAAAFDGLRVVEIAQGMAGPLATQLLADHGADVIKIEPRAGDWARGLPGFVMWNRGKRSVVLDGAEARERVLDLVAGADVLVESVRGGIARVLGMDAHQLRAAFGSLVVCTISGFGLSSHHEHFPAYEAVVAAKSGRLLGADELSGLAVGNDGDRPIYSVSPIGAYGAACLAYIGVVGALRSRLRTGRGCLVETSLLDGITAATMRMRFRRDGDAVVPVADTKKTDLIFAGIHLSFMTAECRDGQYLQMCARQPAHFDRWLETTGLSHLLGQSRFSNGPTGFTSMADIDELEGRLRAAMLERDRDEWMAIFEAFDVGADPFLTPQEFLEQADMVANGRVVEIDDPVIGRITQIGMLALFGTSPSRIGRSAPRLGEHQALLDDLPEPTRPTLSAPAKEPVTEVDTAPFAGVTILEGAYYVAGPLASAILAELGARVIKIEPPGGDAFRAVGVEFAQISHGKESIEIDLKHPRARAIIDQLIDRCDVFMHSFRPGSPERLGLGYEQVHARNPSAVYLYAGSYGSKGPSARRPAFHSTPHALTGAGVMQAGAGNPPTDDSYPDPCAALAVAAAIATGLFVRERDGTGQYVETTMLAAAGYLHSNAIVSFEGRPPVPVVDAAQQGVHPLHRLYQCDDGWLMLACVQVREWQALAMCVGHPEWITDDQLASPALDEDGRAALGTALEEVFVTRSAEEWERQLVAGGVPAARADGTDFELFLVHNTPHTPMSHPQFGDYWLRAPVVRVDGGGDPPAPAPMLGEHTLAILAELGWSRSECDELAAAGLIRSWVPPASNPSSPLT